MKYEHSYGCKCRCCRYWHEWRLELLSNLRRTEVRPANKHNRRLEQIEAESKKETDAD